MLLAENDIIGSLSIIIMNLCNNKKLKWIVFMSSFKLSVELKSWWCNLKWSVVKIWDDFDNWVSPSCWIYVFNSQFLATVFVAKHLLSDHQNTHPPEMIVFIFVIVSNKNTFRKNGN